MQTLFPSPTPQPHHRLVRPLRRNHVFTQTHRTVTVAAASASSNPIKAPILSISFSNIRFSYNFNPSGLLSSITSLFPHQNGEFVEKGDVIKETIEVKEDDKDQVHPYAFHVSGPRNVPTPNWTQLINSSWKDENYRRTVIACFIQAVYLLELDRQENRTEKTSLALNWWKPFNYKVIQTLVDQRDGSIFGALLEWDHSAALSNFILMRPSGAPRAVLALRGTCLTSPTIRRDIEDDLRFVAWENLEGSVRFSTTVEALKFAVDSYGSSNVCIAGHSLGAGFALQVGKMLAKEGICVETHLFNPPSVSLATSLSTIGDSAGFTWLRFKSMLPFSVEPKTSLEENPPSADTRRVSWAMSLRTIGDNAGISLMRLKSVLPFSVNHEEIPPSAGKRRGRWIPHLYVNNNDYICSYYSATTEGSSVDVNADDGSNRETMECVQGEVAAKLFVMSKDKQKFLEAHGLEQWWSDDLKLQSVHNSKLISRQLESIYTFQSSPPARKLGDEKRLLMIPLTRKTINMLSGFLAGWLSVWFGNLGRILWCVPQATLAMIRR